MNALNSMDLLSKTVAEGALIGLALCVLRSLVAMQLERVETAKSTAVFVLIFTSVMPYGAKFLNLLIEGPAGDLAAQGYTLTWLLIATQGRMAGAAIGIALFLSLAVRIRNRLVH